MIPDKVIGPYPPFDYNSLVRWRQKSGSILEGSVCAFTEIDTPEQAADRGLPLGTVLALVEDASGEAIEIPLQELELIE